MVNADDTRAAFSGLIDKPPLTDQLLARPPFKFILDIVSATISKTGFLKDQFSSDDLNPAKLSDKAAKMAFLDTLIQVLNDGSLDDVKSSKIVAGKEPELTNLMLKKLAERAREHKKGKKSSRRSHQDEDNEKPKSKHRSRSKDHKEEKSKSRTSSKHREEKEKEGKIEEKKEEKKERKSSKDRDGHHKSSKKRTDEDKKKKKEKKEKEEIRKNDDENDENRDINSNVVEPQTDQGFDEPSSSHVDSPKSIGNALSPAKTNDSGISDLTESPRPPIIAVPERPMTAALARPQTSMGRPGTAAARPAPPKLKRKQIATVEETTTMVPVQPTAELISEAASPAPEETFLVEEEEVEELAPTNFSANEAELPNDERGGLVQKMMETAAEFDDGGQSAAAEIDQGEFAREKLKAEALLNSLQMVTRTTHPLSRIFDFAQEDLELMIKELEKWRNETKKYETMLMDKEAQGIGDTQKLTNVLSQLDDEVADMRSSVRAAKARISANNERIHEILNGI